MVICVPYRYSDTENHMFCSISRKPCVDNDWKDCRHIPEELRKAMAQNIIEHMSIKDAIYQAVRK